MFLKVTTAGGRAYLQLVESHRVKGKSKQTALHSFGRLDFLSETGQLDRLILGARKIFNQVVCDWST